jgi:hypothetical protein
MKIDRNLTIQRRSGLLITIFLVLVAGLTAAARPYSAAPLVEITEVKNLGVSANNDTKTILQVQWAVNEQPTLSSKSFELAIEVAYADGATERFKTVAGGAERRARFEVPTLHLAAGGPGARLRGFKANIIASFTETVSKQGNF